MVVCSTKAINLTITVNNVHFIVQHTVVTMTLLHSLLMLCMQDLISSLVLITLIMFSSVHTISLYVIDHSRIRFKLPHSNLAQYNINRPPQSRPTTKSRHSVSFSQFLEDFQTLISSVSTSPNEFTVIHMVIPSFTVISFTPICMLFDL